jgi:hypothetical protein
MTDNIQTEYIVHWAEFETKDCDLASLCDENCPIEPSTNIHSGTYRSASFDSREEARDFAKKTLERYPGDEIKWLAYCTINKRTTEEIEKIK